MKKSFGKHGTPLYHSVDPSDRKYIGWDTDQVFTDIVKSIEERIATVDNERKELTKKIHDKENQVSKDQLRTWRLYRRTLKKFSDELKDYLDFLNR